MAVRFCASISAILVVCEGESFRMREGTSTVLLGRGEKHSASIAEVGGMNVAEALITKPVGTREANCSLTTKC